MWAGWIGVYNPINNWKQLLHKRKCLSSSVISLLRCSPPNPPPTTALTCVLRCFPCEPTWAGSPFLHRPPTPPMVRMTRSKTFQAYLPSCHRTYSCIHCRAHLANHDELISKVGFSNSTSFIKRVCHSTDPSEYLAVVCFLVGHVDRESGCGSLMRHNCWKCM